MNDAIREARVEIDSPPQQAPAATQAIDRADLLLAVLVELDAEGVVSLSKALANLPGTIRIVAAIRNSPTAPTSGDNAGQNSDLRFAIVPWSTVESVPGADRAAQTIAATYRSIFAACEKFEARACCVITSKLESRSLEWVSDFAELLLNSDFDLVVPHYPRQRLEGLLNNSLISPLLRALYGKQMQNPMGPDLGISRKLFKRLLGSDLSAKTAGKRPHPIASLIPLVLCNNLRVCEVYLGERIYPPTDWTNISSLLVDVLGPMFLDMERFAPCWQRVRESSTVPGLDGSAGSVQRGGSLDESRLLSSFQLGVRDLQEVWALVLPPATLLELRKISRLAPEQFKVPDELWVRAVYDFALAHRLQTINRDHLLRSLTPLYLGWVASYAREGENGGSSAVEARFERLAAAYEKEKPYLVSRWRWPDRFNP